MLHEKSVLKSQDYALNQTDLLVKRHQDIFTLDWGDVAKNYVLGYSALYILVSSTLPDGKKHTFSFLVVKDSVELCGVVCDEIVVGSSTVSTAKEAGRALKLGDGFDKALPMLVGVSDLVHGPEGVIPSGVWSLGFDKLPLIGREFLFNSILDPGIWERISLPITHATKREGYTGSASTVEFDNIDNHFIERTPQMLDSLDGLEGDVIRQILIEACNYVMKTTVFLGQHGVGTRFDVPIDSRFEVVEFSLSSFDLFL